MLLQGDIKILSSEDFHVGGVADTAPMHAGWPAMNYSLPQSDDPDTPAAASEQPMPESEQGADAHVDGEEDCWTQDRGRMAGAPPCGSDAYGPVEGNAKVQCCRLRTLRCCIPVSISRASR